MKKSIFSVVLLTLFAMLSFPFLVFASSVIIFDIKQYDKGKGSPVTYTDTFSTRDPTAQYTLHVWQGENGLSIAKNGNITLNGAEVVSAGELRKSTGYIAKPVNLQLDNTLAIKLKGKSGVFLKVKVTGTGGNLPNITISSPLNGEVANGENIMIAGTVFSPLPEISVKVNSKLAEINGADYFANNIPLDLGQNIITATLTEVGGYTTEEVISVQTNDLNQSVKLTSNMSGGVPPLTVRFSINTDVSLPVTSYQVDFDDDGIIDFTSDNADNISYTYSSEGIYYVGATITDSYNNSYIDTIAINILSQAVMDTKLQEKWGDMKTALSGGDPAAALDYFSEGSQGKYSEIFAALSGELSALADNMQNVELIYVQGDTAKYRIYRQQDVNGVPETITYYIYFLKDQDGFWKIKNF